MRSILWIAAIALIPVSTPAALTAVIEVNESPYYSANKFNFYGGASLTNFYAPLPVFFEGWKSSPRASIVEYLWDFGDGSPRMPGFNAAHVYEEPGVYTATLIVTDVNGAVDTATVTITVLERTGTTYYVDAENGQDFFDGRSPSTAWRTATHAFMGADRSNQRYGPGDRILFRRGQTFNMTAQVDFGQSKRYGFKFGAFGEGARPIIRNAGQYFGNRFFSAAGDGIAHISFVDLDFRLRNDSNGDVASFWYSAGETNQIMFLRCSLSQFNAGFIQTGMKMHGVFLFNVTAVNGAFVHLYFDANRVAIRDSAFDLAGNHVAYIPRLNKGVFYGNTFSRPAFGRHAFRVSGGDFANPSNNFYIANNYFRGWVDPVVGQSPHGNGQRYNNVVVHLGPNTADPQSMIWATFENNTLVDGETMLSIGSYENLAVRNNLMYTATDAVDPRVLLSSHHGFDRRPLKNIAIHDNFVINGNPASDGSQSRMFEVRQYSGPSYQGSTLHENLSILDNHVAIRNGMVLRLATNSAAQLAQVTSNRQHTNTPVQGNIYEYAGVKYNLPGFQAATGKETQSSVFALDVTPTTPVCVSPEIVDEGPITVSYTGAVDRSGTGLKEVVLWYKRGFGSWIRSDLVSTGSSGSFQFEPVLGSGTYYFWAQAEDNAGNRSLPPLALPTWSSAPNRLTLAQFGDTETFHGLGVVNGELPDPNGPTTPVPPGDAGLIAHYKLDTPPISGVPDSTVNDNDGFVVPPDVPVLVEGYLNGAYQFAQGDRVVLPNIATPTGEISLAAWFNASGFVGSLQDGRIISKAVDIMDNGHWWMLSTFATPDGVRLRFRVKTGTEFAETQTLIASSGNIRIGSWHHAVATYQKGIMRLYLDGKLVGEKFVEEKPIPPGAFVGVEIGNQPGQVPSSQDKSWLGKIDDVRIYSYPLTQPQVNALYEVSFENIGGPPNTPFPVPDQGVPLAAWPAIIGLGIAGAAASLRRRSIAGR